LHEARLLPNYDIFDEQKYFTPGTEPGVWNWNNKRFALMICEDMWAWPTKEGSDYNENPILKVPKKKIDMVINMSASPYHVGKFKKRQFVASQTAKYFKAPLLYVNMVGAQDEIVYDGQSFLVSAKDKVLF
jgi:NAD+ synthase (glutamine-hydrolysing)